MTKDFKEWLEACPYQYDILYDRSNAIDDEVEWSGQVDLAIYTQTKRVRTND
tara:strand:- start:200 stop:355 length:156 start_codon:yes stop_codon:yes gene_type:complete